MNLIRIKIYFPLIPPPRLVPLISNLKNIYILWQTYFTHLPKTSKYSLGEKIDRLLLETLEAACSANFLQKQEKIPYIGVAIRKLDLVKIFFQIAWEIKALDTTKYTIISEKLNEAGKMLGGWYGQLNKTPR